MNTTPGRHRTAAEMSQSRIWKRFDMPGGGISLDGQRWVSSRPAFLLPVRVLGSLLRRLFLTRPLELHTAGQLRFFGKQARTPRGVRNSSR